MALDEIIRHGFEFITLIEIIGTFAFAVSGAIAAIKSRYDLFGVLVLAFVTAIGGGTIRDLLIGNLPVSWLTNSIAIWSAIGGFILTVIFHKWFKEIQSWILFFDAAGLGLFTVMGIQVGLNADMGIGISITLGTITGCFGGVIRDVLSGSRPLIFHKELYATASVFGGLLYVALLTQIQEFWAQIFAILTVIGIRIAAYHFHLRLPKFSSGLSKDSLDY
ncbi:trimeric intracellular cation channel family protein [Aliifodinibius sp. S!AR15-10]|uniref:trimeric intracellular cation channel family protein n=1 Tax=Aliifodinibius sp. S!AR15-10 TaxID=2950437 RepID=UPI002862C122|nr:trimeric intracellular cation channel family protein [Aliifodinibius sp. S!AR15-10]MDR8390782.1 trimeric intracellular cation channel family protein [Aliifodinibius sp. S!AR15-10]